jgi:hypothetical protein
VGVRAASASIGILLRYGQADILCTTVTGVVVAGVCAPAMNATIRAKIAKRNLIRIPPYYANCSDNAQCLVRSFTVAVPSSGGSETRVRTPALMQSSVREMCGPAQCSRKAAGPRRLDQS